MNRSTRIIGLAASLALIGLACSAEPSGRRPASYGAATMTANAKTLNVDPQPAVAASAGNGLRAEQVTNDVKAARAVLDPGPPGATEENLAIGSGILLAEVPLSDLENEPARAAAAAKDKREVFPISDAGDTNVRGTLIYRIDPASGDRSYIEANGGSTRLSRAVLAAQQAAAARPAATRPAPQPQLLHVTGDGVNEYVLIDATQPGPPQATIITSRKERFDQTKMDLNQLAGTLKKSAAENRLPRDR